MSTTVPDNTPIVIGVGEASERVGTPDYAELSPVGLAAAAARAAIADAGVQTLAAQIDVIAGIRQFENSTPQAKAPFGRSDNFPRSVGRRIGADPARAVLEVTGGQGPQHLVNEFAHAIAAGESRLVLLAGSEAISTVRDLATRGETRDWSEEVGGQLEDRGFAMEGLVTAELFQHGAGSPIQLYAMFENARRARLGLDRAAYRLEMARLFAPFTQVAASNPHAMSRQQRSVADLAEITPDNRMVTDPFPRRVIARDQANQGAAVLMTSVGAAREWGVPESQWIYLLGGADVKERSVIDRPDLSRNPAAVAALRQSLEVAGIGLADVSLFDFYSCFPIAVFNVCEGLGLAPDDARGLTVTGGLPFFGGAGNNYSMHAIASMVRGLRARPGGIGVVGANGGFLSKYSVGVYSSAGRPWRPFESKSLQARLDAAPTARREQPAAGAEGTVETYTVDYNRPEPRAVVLARTASGVRFVAGASDRGLIERFAAEEPLKWRVACEPGEKGRLEIRSATAA